MDLFARLRLDVARRPLNHRWLEGAIMEIKVVHKLTPPYFLLLLRTDPGKSIQVGKRDTWTFLNPRGRFLLHKRLANNIRFYYELSL